MTQSFYSNGKLLITGEYVVLDGALALALPTTLGQHLDVETISEPEIQWISLDENNAIWFEDTFTCESLTSISKTSKNPVSLRLSSLLKIAKQNNPEFLSTNVEERGFKVTTKLDFARDWGLGSSSTLINNIALWANVDPMTLLSHTFGGSGYDIACARHNTPILYQVGDPAKVQEVGFDPSFKNELFFIHRNKKQNSRESISTYKQNKTNSNAIIKKINSITSQLLNAGNRAEFDGLISQHERLIGEVTNQTPIKEDLFPDYKYAIKSLGGWGGDFILATGPKPYVHDYFNSKSYTTILSYSELILNS